MTQLATTHYLAYDPIVEYQYKYAFPYILPMYSCVFFALLIHSLTYKKKNANMHFLLKLM